MELDITNIRKLCDKTTPGPWKYDWGNWEVERLTTRSFVCGISDSHLQSCDDWEKCEVDPSSNGEFIAQARTIVPDLLDAYEAIQTKLYIANDDIESLKRKLWKAGKAIDGLKCAATFSGCEDTRNGCKKILKDVDETQELFLQAAKKRGW